MKMRRLQAGIRPSGGDWRRDRDSLQDGSGYKGQQEKIAAKETWKHS